MNILESRNDKDYADRYQKIAKAAQAMSEEQRQFAYHGLVYRATALNAHAGGSSDIWRLDAAEAAAAAELFSGGDKSWKRYMLRYLFLLGEAEEVLRLTSDGEALTVDESFALLYRAWTLEAVAPRQEIVEAYGRLAAFDPKRKEDAESSLKEIESDPDSYSSDVAALSAKLKAIDKKENSALFVMVGKRLCHLGDRDAIELVCDTVFPKDTEPSIWQMFDAHLLAQPLNYVPSDKVGVLRELFQETSHRYRAATLGGALLRKGDDSDARMLLESTKIDDSDRFQIFSWGNRAQMKTLFDSFENAMRAEHNYCFGILGRLGGDAAAKRIIDIGKDELKEGRNVGSLLQTGSGLAYDFVDKEIVRKNDRNAIFELLNSGTNLCADAQAFGILKALMGSDDSQVASLALKSAATIAHLEPGLYKKIKDVADKDPSLAREFKTIQDSGYIVEVS